MQRQDGGALARSMLVNGGPNRARLGCVQRREPLFRNSFDQVVTDDGAWDARLQPGRQLSAALEQAIAAQKKNPRQFPAGALCQVVRPNLPVALSAEEQDDQCPDPSARTQQPAWRSQRTAAEVDRTSVLLVEHGVQPTSAEKVRFLTGVQRVMIPT